ncbi:hypothetical protein EB796_015852 [Bugula neritina]|uniref:Reverse transcriptase domain-containing protein n=1 Tax=Bugula neritina TaxID=10212 RepID=A0A7J7JJQ1_BUGNE|nr:hypothetical protein EB796_015852 [Bugula neritina]
MCRSTMIARLDGHMDPISEEEVVKYLSQKSSGAPGPDADMLKEDKVKKLTSLFNLWLYLGSVPSKICERRTTLIPKAPGTTDPSQYRPITVGSVLLRLYSILGGRLESLLPISQCQKGFRQGDGIFFNSMLLQKCISDAKSKCRNLRLAFLDMRKAFDSVGHGALWAACKRLGIPEHLVRYYSESIQ